MWNLSKYVGSKIHRTEAYTNTVTCKHETEWEALTKYKLVQAHLFIFSASRGLKVRTQRQKISWYWTWKLTLPLRTASRVAIPSTATNANLYSSIRSIICRQRATDCMYSLFWNNRPCRTVMQHTTQFPLPSPHILTWSQT